MFKYSLILGLGVALGYSYGWKDAHAHQQHVAERLLEQIGGDSKDKVNGDIDAQMNRAEKR